MDRRRVGAVILICIVCVWHGKAQSDSEITKQSKQIAGSVLTGTELESLQELCDKFGPRLTGTDNYQRASEWAEDQFRASGVHEVRLEPFVIPNGWQRGWATAEMYAPFEKRLQLESVGWSPPTPNGGVKGEVIVVSDISESALRSEADGIRNHIVLLDTVRVFGGGFKQTYSKLIQSYSIFKALGVQALLLPDDVPNNVLGDWVDTDNGKAEVLPLPVAEIGMEDAKLLRRLLAKTSVTIGFAFDNKITGPVTVNNVVAEIRGETEPDQWVLVGAHLDSWDLGTGAQDNGTGSIMVLETAKAIAALPHPPRRSIRFVLWTGEEPGLLGSKAYVKGHSADLRHIVTVVNTDAETGHPLGWKVDGRQDVAEAMAPFSSEYLKDLGADGLSLKINVDTDHSAFMLQGIPCLDLWIDHSNQDVAHKPADTFDKVDPTNLRSDTVVVAVTVFLLSQLPRPIAPHISHAEVGAIMKGAALDGYLVAHGDWIP